MTRQVLVLQVLLLASPAGAQETLPLRPGLGEVTVTVTNGGGHGILGAAILLDGPTRRQALSEAQGVEFKELPPGRYSVTIRTPDFLEAEHTLTVISGVRYAALWMVGPSRVLKAPSTPPVSRLGPLSITDVKVDPRGDVRYLATNRSRTLMFRRIEVGRVYPDGSSRVDVQEHDSYDSRTLSWLRTPVFSLNGAGESPVHGGESIHLARDTKRADIPVSAHIRVAAVVTADGVALGDHRTLSGVIGRRRTIAAELEYWVGRYEARMREFGGVILSDLLMEELESPRPGEGSSAYRRALLDGIRNVRRGGWDDVTADRVVLAQLKSMVQFHDLALDHLRVLNVADDRQFSGRNVMPQ